MNEWWRCCCEWLWIHHTSNNDRKWMPSVAVVVLAAAVMIIVWIDENTVKRHKEVVKWLMENGAEPYPPNNHGENPYDWALDANRQEIYELFPSGNPSMRCCWYCHSTISGMKRNQWTKLCNEEMMIPSVAGRAEGRRGRACSDIINDHLHYCDDHPFWLISLLHFLKNNTRVNLKSRMKNQMKKKILKRINEHGHNYIVQYSPMTLRKWKPSLNLQTSTIN